MRKALRIEERTKNDIKSLYGIALSMDIAQRVINAVHESLFDDFGISKVDRRVHGTEIIQQIAIINKKTDYYIYMRANE